jgi:hypothetical protein
MRSIQPTERPEPQPAPARPFFRGACRRHLRRGVVVGSTHGARRRYQGAGPAGPPTTIGSGGVGRAISAIATADASTSHVASALASRRVVTTQSASPSPGPRGGVVHARR